VLPAPRAERVLRCLAGLVVLGFGLALMVAADLGLAPWEVLHQGLSERIGIPIGTTGILVGVLVLLAWIPLRERPGLGTVLNVVVIGVTIDVTLLWLDTPDWVGWKVLLLAVGTWLWGPGSSLYIGAGIGPGPRDGLMTGLARRGLPVGRVRLGIELTVLLAGWLLGGTVGIGTVLFTMGIGPIIAWWLPRLALEPPDPEPPRARANLAR
jgi:uncharacterized membrane protein YczE